MFCNRSVRIEWYKECNERNTCIILRIFCQFSCELVWRCCYCAKLFPRCLSAKSCEVHIKSGLVYSLFYSRLCFSRYFAVSKGVLVWITSMRLLCVLVLLLVFLLLFHYSFSFCGGFTYTCVWKNSSLKVYALERFTNFSWDTCCCSPVCMFFSWTTFFSISSGPITMVQGIPFLMHT